MKFRPRFVAFTLAGMPHKNVEEACKVMLRSFSEAPAVPQLSMSVRMYLEEMPCFSINPERKLMSFTASTGAENEFLTFYDRYLSQDLDYFAIDPKYNATLYKLAQMIREKPLPELRLIHFSIPGPYTVGLQIKDESGAPAFYNDTLRDVITKMLAMKAKWYKKEVKRLFPDVGVLFQIGEPALSVYSSSGGTGSWDVIQNALNEILETVGEDGCISCIHCCANIDWSLLMKTNIDCIHFDAYQYGKTMSLYPDALKRFIERGGLIGWGIVPTTGSGTNMPDIENENPAGLVGKLESHLQSVIDIGIDEKMVLESSWVASSCATSTLLVELAERVFDFTKEVSQRMKGKYFG